MKRPSGTNFNKDKTKRGQNVRNSSRGQGFQERELLSVVILVEHVGLEMRINREVDRGEWNVPHQTRRRSFV